jgi:hypothetical protein
MRYRSHFFARDHDPPHTGAAGIGSPPKAPLTNHHLHVVGGAQKGIAAPRIRISFVKLWQGYPDSHPYVDPKTGNDPPGFDSQCAIKLSVSLHAAGVDLDSFKGASVRVRETRLAIRAEELASWLKLQHFDGVLGAVDITGENWQDKIKGKRGIVSFANYWTRDGEKTPTGDHIDLWNADTLTSSGLAGFAVSFARFRLGMHSFIGFSDLGKASKIMFWEVQ